MNLIVFNFFWLVHRIPSLLEKSSLCTLSDDHYLYSLLKIQATVVSALSAQDSLKLLASKDAGDAIEHAKKLKGLIQSKKSQHIQCHERTPGFEYLSM